jgi:hypothetical protein
VKRGTRVAAIRYSPTTASTCCSPSFRRALIQPIPRLPVAKVEPVEADAQAAEDVVVAVEPTAPRAAAGPRAT